MTNIEGKDVFKIHGSSWEAADYELMLRVSLFGSDDIAEISISNEGFCYRDYEDKQGLLPYYIDAPDTIKNIMQFSVRSYQSIFKAMLFSIIYPVFCGKLEYQKMSVGNKELAVLTLMTKIHNLHISKTSIAGTEDPDMPIEKSYRLHLEEKPTISANSHDYVSTRNWRD